tara:strand:+ start:450 stop:1214 length:765 start_codon:yes stop_codon:yes gene_type:complete
MAEEQEAVVQENTEQPPVVQETSQDVDALVRAAVDKEVAGLKANNQALKEEKKKFQDRAKIIDDLGGEEGIKQFQEMQTRLAEDEDTKLFLSGDRDKYNQRITNRVREDAEARITAIQVELDASNERASLAEDQYRNQQVALSIREATGKAGVNPRLSKAVEGQIVGDVFFDKKQNEVFVRDPNDPDSIRYGREGKPMTVIELVDMMREDQPELFLSSTGASAVGGSSSSRLLPGAVSKMSMSEYVKARKEGRV